MLHKNPTEQEFKESMSKDFRHLLEKVCGMPLPDPVWNFLAQLIWDVWVTGCWECREDLMKKLTILRENAELRKDNIVPFRK